MPIALRGKKQLLVRLKDLALGGSKIRLLVSVAVILVPAHLVSIMSATVLLLMDHASAHAPIIRILILHRDNYVSNSLASTG
jgi:hypothetical protein